MAHILEELKKHIPYSVFSSIFALVIVAILTVITNLNAADRLPEVAHNMFHLFHPIHLLLSATATTAMFWKYNRRLLKAVLIGFAGAVLVCGISDIIMPFLGGTIVGVQMELHICVLEEPGLVLPFVFVGIFTGLAAAEYLQKATIFSHTTHVFVSSMATVLYLISYGLVDWISFAGAILVLVFLSTVIPCCLSDIVFPLFLVRKKEDSDDAFCCLHAKSEDQPSLNNSKIKVSNNVDDSDTKGE